MNYELSNQKAPMRSQALLNAVSDQRIGVNGSSTAQYGLHSPNYQRDRAAEMVLGRNMNTTLSKIKFQKEYQGKKVPFKITDNQRIASMKPYRSKVALFISNKKDQNNRSDRKPQSLDRVNQANIDTQEYLNTVGISEAQSILPEDQFGSPISPVIIIKQNQSKTIDHAQEHEDTKLVDHNSFMMQTLSQFQPSLSIAPQGHMNKYKGFSAAKQKQLIQGYQQNIDRAIGSTMSNQQLFGETFLANVSGRQALKQQTRFQELKERLNIDERRAEVKHMKKYTQLKKNSIVTSGSNLNSDISQVNLPYFERVFIANEKFKKVASYEAMKIQMAQKKPETRQGSQVQADAKQFEQKKNSGNDRTLQFNESEQQVLNKADPKKDEVIIMDTEPSKDVTQRVKTLQDMSAGKKQSLNKDFGFGSKDSNHGQYIDTNLLDVIGSEMDYSPQISRDPRPGISGLGKNKPKKPPIEVSPIATLQLNSSMMASETVQPENTLDLQLRQSKQITEAQRLGLTSEKIDDTTSNAQSKNMKSAAFSIQPDNINLVLVGPNVDSEFQSLQQGINQNNGNSIIQHNVTSPTWNSKSPTQQRQEVIGWSQGVTQNMGLKSPLTGITSKNSTMDRLFKMQPKIHQIKEIKVGVKGKEDITKTFSPAKSNTKSPRLGTLQLGTKEHNSRTLNSMTSSIEVVNHKQQQVLAQKSDAQKLNKKKYNMSRVNYFEGDPSQMDHLPQVMGTSFGIQLYQPVPTITEEQDYTAWSKQEGPINIQGAKNANQIRLINNVLQKTAAQNPDDEKVQLQVDARLFNIAKLQSERNPKDDTKLSQEQATKDDVEPTNQSIGISPYNSPPVLTRNPSGANYDANDTDLKNMYPLLGKIQSEAASMFSPPQILEAQNGPALSSMSPFKETITIPPATLESSHQKSLHRLDKQIPYYQNQIQIDINLKKDLLRQTGRNLMAAKDSYSSILQFSDEQNLSENASRRTIQISNDVQGIRNLYELFQRDPTNPQIQSIIQNLSPQFTESLAMINSEAELHRRQSKGNSKQPNEKKFREDFHSLNLTRQQNKKGKNQYKAIREQLQQIENRRNSNKRQQGSFSTINQESVKLPKVRVKRQSPMEEILQTRQGLAARNLAASLYSQFNTQKDQKLEKNRSVLKKDQFQTHTNLNNSDVSSGYGSGDQAASSTRQVPLQGSTLYHNSSSGFLSHGLNPNTHHHLSRSMLQDPGLVTQKNFEMGQTQKEDLQKQAEGSDQKSALRWKQVKPQDYMEQHARFTQKQFPKQGSHHNLTLNTDLETVPQNLGNSVFEGNQTTNQDLFTGTQGSIQVGGNIIMRTVYGEGKPQQSPQQSPFGVTTNFANPKQMQMALNPHLLQTMQDQNINKKDLDQLYIDTQNSFDAKEGQTGTRNAVVTMGRNSPTVVLNDSNQFEYLAGGKYKPEFLVSGTSNMNMNIISGQNSKTSLSNKSHKKKKNQKPVILVGVSNNMKSNIISPNTGVNVTKKVDRSPNAFSAILSRSNSKENSRNDSGLNTTHRYLEEDSQHLKYGHSTLQGNDHIKVQISGGNVIDSIQKLTNKSGAVTNARNSPRAQPNHQQYAPIPELAPGEIDHTTLSKSRGDEVVATQYLTPENLEQLPAKQILTQQTKEANSHQNSEVDDKTEQPALTNARDSQVDQNYLNEPTLHASVPNKQPSSILFDDQRGPEKPTVVKIKNSSRMSRDSLILRTPSAIDTPAGEKPLAKSQMSTGMRSAFQQADLPSEYRANESHLQQYAKESKNQNPFQNQQRQDLNQQQNVTLGPFPHSMPPSEFNTLYVQQQLQAQLAMNTAILEEQQRTIHAMQKDALDKILQPIPEIHAQVSTLPDIGIQTGKYEILNPPVLEIKDLRQLETKQYEYQGLPNYVDKQPYVNMTYQQRLLHNNFGKRQRMKTEIKGMANRGQNDQYSLLKNNQSGIRLSKSNVQSVKQFADKNTVSPVMTMYQQRKNERNNSPLQKQHESKEILQPNFPDQMMIIKPVLSKTNIELPESLAYPAPRKHMTQMASKKALVNYPKEHLSTMYIDPAVEQQSIDLRNVRQSGGTVIHQNGDLEEECFPKTHSHDTNTRSQINIIIPPDYEDESDSVPKFSSLNKGLEKKKYVNYLGEIIADRIKKQMPNTMKNKNNRNHIIIDVNNSSPGYQQNTQKSLNQQQSIYFQKKRLSNILNRNRNDKL